MKTRRNILLSVVVLGSVGTLMPVLFLYGWKWYLWVIALFDAAVPAVLIIYSDEVRMQFKDHSKWYVKYCVQLILTLVLILRGIYLYMFTAGYPDYFEREVTWAMQIANIFLFLLEFFTSRLTIKKADPLKEELLQLKLDESNKKIEELNQQLQACESSKEKMMEVEQILSQVRENNKKLKSEFSQFDPLFDVIKSYPNNTLTIKGKNYTICGKCSELHVSAPAKKKVTCSCGEVYIIRE